MRPRGKVPGTYLRRQWVWADNPAYEGKTPRPLTAACHDGTPFLTIACPACSAQGHIHESQIGGISLPLDVEFGFRCPECSVTSIVPAGFFTDAFARMRADGWIK
jgi:hypothetical protein